MASSQTTTIPTHPAHTAHTFMSLSSAEYTTSLMECETATAASSVSCRFPGLSSSSISLFAILVSLGTLINIYIPLRPSIVGLFCVGLHYDYFLLPDLAILAVAQLLTRAYLVYWKNWSQIQIHEATRTARHLGRLPELEEKYIHEKLSKNEENHSVCNELQKASAEKKELSQTLREARKAKTDMKGGHEKNIKEKTERLQRRSARGAKFSNKGNNDPVDFEHYSSQLSLISKANDNITSQFTAVSARNKHLLDQLNTVTREKDIIISNACAANESLQSQLNILASENHVLIAHLASASADYVHLLDQLNTMTKENGIIPELLDASAENNSLQIRPNTVTEEKDKAVSQLIDTSSEIEGLMSHLSIASGQREYLASQLADVSAEKKRLVSQLNIVSKERDYLTFQLGNTSTENQILKSQTASLAKLHATASSEHVDLMKALRKAQEQCVTAEEKWAKAEKEMRSPRNKRSVISRQLEEKDRELFAVHLKLNSANFENNRLTHVLSTLKAELVNNKIALKDLTREVNAKYEVKEAELCKQFNDKKEEAVSDIKRIAAQNDSLALTNMRLEENIRSLSLTLRNLESTASESFVEHAPQPLLVPNAPPSLSKEGVSQHSAISHTGAIANDASAIDSCAKSTKEHRVQNPLQEPMTGLLTSPCDGLSKTQGNGLSVVGPKSVTDAVEVAAEVSIPPPVEKRPPAAPFSSTGLKLGDIDLQTGDTYTMEVAFDLMSWNASRSRHSTKKNPKRPYTVEEVMWEMKQIRLGLSTKKTTSSVWDHKSWKLEVVDGVLVVVRNVHTDL